MVSLGFKTVLIIVFLFIGFLLNAILMERREEKMQKKDSTKFVCISCKSSFYSYEAIKNNKQLLCPQCRKPCLEKIKSGKENLEIESGKCSI